jgi:hypothetical protein
MNNRVQSYTLFCGAFVVGMLAIQPAPSHAQQRPPVLTKDEVDLCMAVSMSDHLRAQCTSDWEETSDGRASYLEAVGELEQMGADKKRHCQRVGNAVFLNEVGRSKVMFTERDRRNAHCEFAGEAMAADLFKKIPAFFIRKR